MHPGLFENLRQAADFLIAEIGRTEFIALVRVCALWGAFGAGLGLLLGLGAYRLFRRLRWYAAVSPAGCWTHRTLCVLTTGLSVLLLGGAGVWEGVRRESPGTLARSRIGTQALPGLADLLATELARLDLITRPNKTWAQAGEDLQVEAFQAGAWELDVPAFLLRLESLRREVYDQVSGELQRAALEKMPWLRGGISERFLHRTVSGLIPALLDRKLSSELQRKGLDQLHAAVRDRLVAEAARAGNPATIGYRDLSAFILREGLAPVVLVPVLNFARQQAILYVILALLGCVLPAFFCRLTRQPPATPTSGPV